MQEPIAVQGQFLGRTPSFCAGRALSQSRGLDRRRCQLQGGDLGTPPPQILRPPEPYLVGIRRGPASQDKAW